MAILAWRPRHQPSPRVPVSAAPRPVGAYAGRARFRPINAEWLPAELCHAVGRVIEVGFAGIAPREGPFAGQELYLEWRNDDVLGGFVIPAQDLEFVKESPDPNG